MFDPHIQFDRRYAFYFDHEGNIHPLCPDRLDRLQASKPDATLPEMAGQPVRFAVFHVERFTSPPRIVVSEFSLLPLDADGRIDQQRFYDALQCEVDQLEANDYAAPTPTPTQAETIANLDEHFGTLTGEPSAILSDSTDPAASSPVHTPSSTHWTPDPPTYRRLVAALRDLRRPSWLTQPASRTAA